MAKKRGISHKHKTIHKHTAKHYIHEYAKIHAVHKKSPLPPGIKVLIAYAAVVLAFYLIYFFFGITKPVSIFFGTLLTGNAALFIDILSVAMLVAIIVGLKKRDYWVFWLSLAWFSYGVLNAIFSAFMIKTELAILKEMMLLSAVSVLLLNGLIVWYIYSEKEYFKTKHLNKETKTKDKLFVYIIASVLIISMLFTATLGFNFYKTTIKTANEIIQEFDRFGASPLVCEEKSNHERDICYVALTIAMQTKDNTMCNNIESDFYKLTCYRALS